MPDLRLVEAACRNQSFTKAARECLVSRPAVSAQVQKVEKLIGAPLFTRDGGRMRPTPAAWDLALAYAQARMIMQRAINQVLV